MTGAQSDRRPRLAFLHVPKTAGTSLRHALAGVAGETSELFRAGRMTVEEARALDHFDVICGHMSRADQLAFFPDRQVITVLREPVERCVSWIKMVRKDQSIPMVEFLHQAASQRNLCNRMVRQLGGHILDDPENLDLMLENAKTTLKQAMWVGRQTELLTDLKLLWQKLGVWAPSLPRLNTARSPKDKPFLFDNSVLELILSWNRHDSALWHWACANLFYSSPNDPQP